MYATGELEDAPEHFTKLLRISLQREEDASVTHYLGFVHLGIAMSALKLEEFDIASHAFERAKTLVTYGVCLCAEDKLRNRGEVGFVGIKSPVGLALVYLNQHACGAHAKEVSAERKRHSLRKS